jgi:hypothetical protein
MYVQTAFDDYVMAPRTGSDLVAKSPAIAFVQQQLKEPYRAYGVDLTLTPGYSALLDLEGLSGPDALFNPYQSELCKTAGIAYAEDWRLLIPAVTIGEFKPMYDLLNLRYYLRAAPPGSPPLPGLHPIARADLEIDESKEVWPRAFFTDNLREYQTTGQFTQLVLQGDGRPFAAVQSGTGNSPASGAVLPATPPAAGYANRQVLPATDYHLTTNTTEFTVKASGPGVAVLTECFEEGNFIATINGTPAPYFRINHAFKGVWLDHAGEYRLRFTYWPKLLTPALWLSALGLAAGFISAIIAALPRKP